MEVTDMNVPYGAREWGTVLSPRNDEDLVGRMFAFIPVPGKPLGTEFYKKELGWFKWEVYEDFDYTAVVKMGVKQGWWLDQVKYSSTDYFPSPDTRAKFCSAKPEDTYPHVYDVDTTNYDPYGMNYLSYFKRTCLSSFVKNNVGEYGDYCQASEDKWGVKNCPPQQHSRRLLIEEEEPVQMLGDDNSIVKASSESAEDAPFGRELYDRQCFRHNKLMIRGRFCTLHSTYHGY
jgi:hypothetical protein